MPWRADEVRIDLVCGRDADGNRRGWYAIHVTAPALRRLGLHPDQPESAIVTPWPRWSR